MTAGGERSLYVAGTGSFAAEIAGWAAESGDEPAGLIELRDPARVGRQVHGLPIVPVEPPPPGARALLGLGGDRQANWAALERAGWAPAGLVHPGAHLSATASVAPSATVGPMAVVGAETSVGRHAIVSRGALVGHHVEIGDFVTLNPGVNVGGNADVGDRAFVGMGAVVLNGVAVGADARVAAGAVAIGDVADGERVQGLPARPYER
jgi:UDP-perosamine 4-acetyltransferase